MTNILTPLQQEGLRWIVARIREGEIEESFLIAWAGDDPLIARCRIEPIPKFITRGSIDAWAQAGMVLIREDHDPKNNPSASLWCTVTQAAYEAVDSNFVDYDDQPNNGRLLVFLSECYKFEELRTLTTRLGIDYESIEGATKNSFARELIDYMKRRGRLWDLVHEAFSME